MNNPHAAKLPMERVHEKLPQGMLGLGDVQSMEVKLSLDAVLAAPELAEDGTLETPTVENQLVARSEGWVVCATR